MSELKLVGLRTGYGRIKVVHGIDLHVPDGEAVALLGPNGAGKTTTLRALSGLLPYSGRLFLDGKDISGVDAARRARMGLAHVPQGRGTFSDFSVEENLRLGAYGVDSRPQIAQDIEYWFDKFPILRERAKTPAGTLSGGQQQMLAVARALMSRPRILLCDEPSLGLAPAITQQVFNVLRELRTERRLSMLIVEQNADISLAIASRGYVMAAGYVSHAGTSTELLADPSFREAFLGV